MKTHFRKHMLIWNISANRLDRNRVSVATPPSLPPRAKSITQLRSKVKEAPL